jgi:drug/metabolite transporter (DMT)-like permease
VASPAHSRGWGIELNGVAWALVAAFGFGVTQILNRKSNQLVDAYRTAFGLLVVVGVVLTVRMIATGEVRRLEGAPGWALGCFAIATLFHFGGGWTLLALSQQKVGVARTGALVSAAPLVGAVMAAIFLDEPLTVLMGLGVVVVVAGVVLLSLSGALSAGGSWSHPWYALTVALLWGTSPLLIRLGLAGLDAPVLGLTVGIVFTVVAYALGLLLTRRRRSRPPARALMWMAAGGLTGALAIAAQWISYSLTTVAVALSLQQLAVLVVLALVPLVFREPLERISPLLIVGTMMMLVGTVTVVLARQ